jgi:hypothetical protein
MYRFLFLFLALILCPSLYAQDNAIVPVDPDTHLITFREVVMQEGDKDLLYDRGAEWFRTYYKNPTSVTKVQDKVNGKIEGTGRFQIVRILNDKTRVDAGMILYDIKVEFKDGKYRYTLTNFNLRAASKDPIERWMNKKDPAYNPQWDEYLTQVDTTMKSLIVNLKKGMQPRVIKKDEW